jgi:hypothetical protein
MHVGHHITGARKNLLDKGIVDTFVWRREHSTEAVAADFVLRDGERPESNPRDKAAVRVVDAHEGRFAFDGSLVLSSQPEKTKFNSGSAP